MVRERVKRHPASEWAGEAGGKGCHEGSLSSRNQDRIRQSCEVQTSSRLHTLHSTVLARESSEFVCFAFVCFWVSQKLKFTEFEKDHHLLRVCVRAEVFVAIPRKKQHRQATDRLKLENRTTRRGLALTHEPSTKRKKGKNTTEVSTPRSTPERSTG